MLLVILKTQVIQREKKKKIKVTLPLISACFFILPMKFKSNNKTNEFFQINPTQPWPSMFDKGAGMLSK